MDWDKYATPSVDLRRCKSLMRSLSVTADELMRQVQMRFINVAAAFRHTLTEVFSMAEIEAKNGDFDLSILCVQERSTSPGTTIFAETRNKLQPPPGHATKWQNRIQLEPPFWTAMVDSEQFKELDLPADVFASIRYSLKRYRDDKSRNVHPTDSPLNPHPQSPNLKDCYRRIINPSK